MTAAARRRPCLCLLTSGLVMHALEMMTLIVHTPRILINLIISDKFFNASIHQNSQNVGLPQLSNMTQMNILIEWK